MSYEKLLNVVVYYNLELSVIISLVEFMNIDSLMLPLSDLHFDYR